MSLLTFSNYIKYLKIYYNTKKSIQNSILLLQFRNMLKGSIFSIREKKPLNSKEKGGTMCVGFRTILM